MRNVNRKNPARGHVYKPRVEQLEDRNAPGNALPLLLSDDLLWDQTEPAFSDDLSSFPVADSVAARDEFAGAGASF